jgi:uncharacterized protein YlxP (DUF503 family)
MIIGSGKVYLLADWCHSLKEKRTVVKSIINRIKNKFNVSISEVEDNDIHNSIVIGFVCVSSDTRHVQSMLQAVVDYIDNNFETVIVGSYIEIL